MTRDKLVHFKRSVAGGADVCRSNGEGLWPSRVTLFQSLFKCPFLLLTVPELIGFHMNIPLVWRINIRHHDCEYRLRRYHHWKLFLGFFFSTFYFHSQVWSDFPDSPPSGHVSWLPHSPRRQADVLPTVSITGGSSLLRMSTWVWPDGQETDVTSSHVFLFLKHFLKWGWK